MDARVESLNQHLKSHDRALYAQRSSNGVIQVYRQGTRWESFGWGDGVMHYSRPSPHFILALTENWTLNTPGVDWGIEPVIWKLKEWDSWRDGGPLHFMRKERERAADIKERSLANEFRALAADSRRDFAKATNGINTSTLERVDLRRKKNGTL